MKVKCYKYVMVWMAENTTNAEYKFLLTCCRGLVQPWAYIINIILTTSFGQYNSPYIDIPDLMIFAVTASKLCISLF